MQEVSLPRFTIKSQPPSLRLPKSLSLADARASYLPVFAASRLPPQAAQGLREGGPP